MNELIKAINDATGFRVEVIYKVYADKEGYKARFYADDEDDAYRMKDVFQKPIDAVKQLILDCNIKIN